MSTIPTRLTLQELSADEIWVRDPDTDNNDCVATVGLTGDADYDEKVMRPFAEALVYRYVAHDAMADKIGVLEDAARKVLRTIELAGHEDAYEDEVIALREAIDMSVPEAQAHLLERLDLAIGLLRKLKHGTLRDAEWVGINELIGEAED